jgi:hypothetical protein
MWITETALATALNGSDLAEQLANFGIVVGIALLLAGVGFVILAVGGALRRTDVTRALLRAARRLEARAGVPVQDEHPGVGRPSREVRDRDEVRRVLLSEELRDGVAPACVG